MRGISMTRLIIVGLDELLLLLLFWVASLKITKINKNKSKIIAKTKNSIYTFHYIFYIEKYMIITLI